MVSVHVSPVHRFGGAASHDSRGSASGRTPRIGRRDGWAGRNISLHPAIEGHGRAVAGSQTQMRPSQLGRCRTVASALSNRSPCPNQTGRSNPLQTREGTRAKKQGLKRRLRRDGPRHPSPTTPRPVNPRAKSATRAPGEIKMAQIGADNLNMEAHRDLESIMQSIRVMANQRGAIRAQLCPRALRETQGTPHHLRTRYTPVSAHRVRWRWGVGTK